MQLNEIMAHVDHTLLNPCATWQEISALCDEAIHYGTASVCIPPSYVQRVHQTYGEQLVICTVIGFPLGYAATQAKVQEVRTAIEQGAREVDMVVNLCDVKNGDFEKVTAEIRALRQAAGKNILKVIVETCYLTEEEKIALCSCVTQAGADFIKTSTGFGSGGATLADIRLFQQHIGSTIKIKAAGGIRTRADFESFLEQGCQRLGTSSAVKVLVERETGNGY